MNTAMTVVDFGHKQSDAYIRKGQRAWTQIKATAAEQRGLWLDIGVALLEGKNKFNRPLLGSNPTNPKRQKFSEWVIVKFPGLDHAPTISDALWFAEFFTTIVKIPEGLTHPQSIRKWFNEAQALRENTDPVLRDAPAPAKKLSVVARIGKRLSELCHRRKIVCRWLELEAKVPAVGIPTNFKEAMLMCSEHCVQVAVKQCPLNFCVTLHHELQ